MYGLKERDVIRVKVKYCDDENEPQIKKFAIDPRLTNYDILLGLLIKGLNIKREFIIHYLATDDFGEQFYLPLLSDWDLDAAILTASDPMLRLKVNLKHQEKVEWRHSFKLYNLSFDDTDDLGYFIDLDEWDIVVPGEAPVKLSKSNLKSKGSNIFKQNMAIKPVTLSTITPNNKINQGSFFNQMYQQVEKTVTSMQRVFSNSKLNDSIQNKFVKSPMSDIEFRNYMDNIGRIIQPEEFKQSVYLGGLEPSLRKVGWRLLLNVYPVGLTGRERLNLLEKKTKHYRSLKHSWKQNFKTGKLTESQMAQIALVSVDVIRTDKSLNFYSGEKNHQHVAQLFDILATYCIYHPSVGYYQGMSDLASPLLFVQCDEAVAYLCFCSLMRRINCNFVARQMSRDNINSVSYSCKENGLSQIPQSGMMNKLQHFYDLLLYLDRELALFLRDKHLGNLFFAHRWILLEMKREFSFLESLRLLEVQWASLPQSPYISEPSKEGVSLIEDGITDSIVTGPLCPQHCTNHLNKRPAKVRCYAVRDMTIICSLVGPQYAPSPQSTSPSAYSIQRMMNSCDYDQHTSCNHMLSESEENSDFPFSDINESDSSDNSQTLKFPDDCLCVSTAENNGITSESKQQKRKSTRVRNQSTFSEDERRPEENGDKDDADFRMTDGIIELPPPDELGHGNPFLLFLCVSLLLEYREGILKGVNEASDILMLYQKLNQRHNITQVLNRARNLFDQYLRDQEIKRRNLTEFPEIELSM